MDFNGFKGSDIYTQWQFQFQEFDFCSPICFHRIKSINFFLKISKRGRLPTESCHGSKTELFYENTIIKNIGKHEWCLMITCIFSSPMFAFTWDISRSPCLLFKGKCVSFNSYSWDSVFCKYQVSHSRVPNKYWQMSNVPSKTSLLSLHRLLVITKKISSQKVCWNQTAMTHASRKHSFFLP